MPIFKEKLPWSEAFKATNPVMLGYIPIGIALGLLFTEIDVHWLWAVVMSLVVYAGAAQFLAIPLILEGASLFDIAIVTLLLNLRHIFYGLSFIDRFASIGFIKKNYLIFGLTDEAYSILTTAKDLSNENFIFLVIFLCHVYWVTGAAIGAFLGHLIPYDLSFLSFSLIALFIILTIEQAKNVKSCKPFLIAGISSMIAMFLFPDYMLIVTLVFAAIYIMLDYKYGKL
jgi:4-azaleucine resistance transporter AzlC